MSRPAVFFDRDNTLIANGDYLGDPDGVVLLGGAADAVARVRALGFATVVVSNQSGIGRGMFNEADARAVNDRMDEALLEANADAHIDRHEFCAHHPEASVAEYRGDHRRRKPQPGMLLDAAEAMDLDLARSWLIGDAPRDVEAGHRAGCRTVLLREALASASPAAADELTVEPDYVASSLGDAVDFIEMHFEQARASVFATAEPVGGARESAVDDVPAEADGVEVEPAPRPALDEGFVEGSFETPAAPLVASVDAEPAIPTAAGNGVAAVSSRLGLMNDAIAASAPPAGTDRQTVMLLERVLEELRRANDPPQDFSVSRMLAGIVQGFAIAAMFGAMLSRDNPAMFNALIMLAIFLQAMVSSLVLMGR